MEEVFTRFKEIFEQRFQRVQVTDMGEDSIRYDFFLAFKEIKNLNSWDIQLEYPICSEAFTPRANQRSYRKEKPQIDLWVDLPELKLACEFGFFRQNSNINGSINVTNKTFKMLDDFMRLFLHCHFTNSTGYFICVADDKILGHQLQNRTLGAFPSPHYKFNNLELDWIIGDKKSKLEERFLNKLGELKLNVNATLVFNEEITSKINPLETRVLVWKIIN